MAPVIKRRSEEGEINISELSLVSNFLPAREGAPGRPAGKGYGPQRKWISRSIPGHRL
jgi:hypothetical protein